MHATTAKRDIREYLRGYITVSCLIKGGVGGGRATPQRAGRGRATPQRAGRGRATPQRAGRGGWEGRRQRHRGQEGEGGRGEGNATEGRKGRGRREGYSQNSKFIKEIETHTQKNNNKTK